MKKRKTLGFLTHEIDGIFSTLLWLSVKKAADKYGCNLIAFEGRILDYGTSVDRQHNIVYKFADKNRLDGLIVAIGTLLNKIDYFQILDFCRQFKDLPLISLGGIIPGTTSILMDNAGGMKSLTRHLIKEHKYRRIAFIKGPDSNTEANERFQAYVDVLKENDIEIDGSIIFNGDFNPDSGYRIMKEQIRNNINFQAVICANDEMSIGVLKASRELNFEVPRDFAVCGFDDTVNASIITPSLTTVHQPISEMCDTAVELLLKNTDNKALDEIIISPGTLIKRESCGCICGKSSTDSSIDVDLRVIKNYKIHENIQTYSLDEFFEQLTGALKNYNIRSCFIAKYLEGMVFFDDNFTFPENSELIYAYCNYKRLEVDNDSKYFRTKDIIPDISTINYRRFTFLVKPLFFKNEHFGFVVFEIENDDVIYFELLRGQISTTLKGALMLIEREKMEKCLREQERLASLGQLIGGISHSFNTPIISTSGVCVGLEELVKEYRESIGDPSVISEDYFEMVQEMSDWLEKLRKHVSYMSQIITAVKKQAVQLNASTTKEFTIEELVAGISFLINNNLSAKSCNLNIKIDVDQKTIIKGEVSNLVQVLSNIIINAFHSYEGTDSGNRSIDFKIYRERNFINFIIKDYGAGMPDYVKSKIFKQMVTTKGKNGTGLSLLLSYSTILGKFGGEMRFETAPNQGTTFFITIPVQ